jgi:hypothetical protein
LRREAIASQAIAMSRIRTLRAFNRIEGTTMRHWLRAEVRAGAVFAVLSLAATATAEVAVEPGYIEPGPPGWERFSLIYSPEVALEGGSLGEAAHRIPNGADVQNIGFELSQLTGWLTRYHAQLDFTHGYGANGIRFEPLAFGWALPLLRGRDFGLEFEPLLSLADGMVLFTHDDNNGSNVSFLLGSGAEIQLNMTVGPFYAFLSPLGIEVRWLEVTNGAGGNAWTGADAFWRFRVGVGVQY